MTKIIVALGELLWDLLPGGKVLGGAPANFIFRINSFGDSGQLITRIGNDLLGKEALAVVRNLNLSDDNIQIDQVFPTGTVDIVLDEKGIPDYTIHKEVAYDYLELTAASMALARQANCICFGSLIQRSGRARETIRRLIREADHAIRFFDINLRKDCYSSEVITESLKLTNILKINDEELFSLKKMFRLQSESLKDLSAELIEKFDLEIILVTLGEKGAFVVAKTGDYHYDPGYRVKLGDTVGSGDACSAGFIHQLMNGQSLEESLKFGNAAGAKVATTLGGTQVIGKKEIIDFMNEAHERISL